MQLEQAIQCSLHKVFRHFYPNNATLADDQGDPTFNPTSSLKYHKEPETHNKKTLGMAPLTQQFPLLQSSGDFPTSKAQDVPDCQDCPNLADYMVCMIQTVQTLV